MSVALRRGREEAFRCFVDCEWVDIIVKTWLVDASVVAGREMWMDYAVGVQGSRKEEFVAFLHEPRNLELALIMMDTPDVASSRISMTTGR